VSKPKTAFFGGASPQGGARRQWRRSKPKTTLFGVAIFTPDTTVQA
jgi:hypothetical protein